MVLLLIYPNVNYFWLIYFYKLILMDKILMKKVTLIISVLLLLTFIFSCSDKDSSKVNDLQYDIVKYEKKSDGCEGLKEDNCAKIKIEFPQITNLDNSGIKDRINNSIKLLFSMSQNSDPDSINLDEEMNLFIEDYEEFMAEFPDAFQSWFVEMTGEVKLNRGNIFSIDYMEYSYTGGAHPNTMVEFRNYNLSSGDEITLDEIIPPDNQNELTKIGEEEFRLLKELEQEADLGLAGFWFENNQFYLNDNFLITDSSLVFYYNNYEITAYAFGSTELSIPFSKIKTLIDDKSLIKPLIE